MPLSDHFSDNQKADLAKDTFDKLEVGTVFFMPVKDTSPPKPKYFIVIGKNTDSCCFASIYINSEVNKKVNYTQELRDLHIPLLREMNPFLHHDSYTNCSKIHEKNYSDIISDDMNIIDGSVHADTLRIILDTLKNAKPIARALKKKYGLI
jgi:hypothetical protein